MRKNLSKIAVLMAITLLLTTLCSCAKKTESIMPSEYVIQYTDNLGVHNINVTSGSVYSLDVLPEKYGYEFLGLFDAKTGGTQYIDETGSSLSAFTDNKNMVLFPQFKAKEYTLILDYQGAAVTGSRSMTISYDSVISELPINLSLEYKNFTGWYTEPNGKGIQIADEYGVLPANNKVTETIFDLSRTDNTIYLYAGFENVKYTVTFYFENNNNPEEIKVEHGTDIKDIVPETRVNGNAVLTWSKIKNDTNKEYVFTGKVTDDLVLYATEYAPVINFDENGGEEVIPVVARAGSSVSLPTPTRENYKFIEWQDENGNTYNSTTMPTQSVTLKAVWQAKLVFDENGGTEVTDISKAVGESITLPTPEKEGFIFAGWYTVDKERYTSTIMPSTAVVLKAGWYKAKEETIVKIASTEVIYIDLIKPSTDKCENGLSTNQLSDDYVYGLYFNFASQFGFQNTSVTIEWHFKSRRIDKSSNLTKDKMHFDFYSAKAISSTNLLDAKTIDIDNSAYKDYTFTSTFEITDSLYVFWYCNEKPSGYANNSCIKDLYYTIRYPDTTKLYL